MITNRLLIGCILIFSACGEDAGLLDRLEPDQKISDLYVASTKVWQTTNIPVCWENPGAVSASERGWVQDAVARSWSQAAAMDFSGWGTCAAGSPGIHIRISDEGPHTVGLGTQLNGVTDGMVLNFTYKNWSTSCQTNREFCSRAVAVHEFGHALGFAHEQNRPDKPATCTDAPQGGNGDLTLGAWDLNSVMNYCNPAWNNGGRLSAGDISGVVQIYGAAAQKPRLWLADFGYINGGWRVEKHPRFLADVNGDGRADVVGFADAGVLVSLSTGSGFAAATLWAADFGYINGGWRVEKHPRFLADINGDGRADVVGFGDAGVFVALSTGSGFSAATLWAADFGYVNGGWRVEKHPRFLADVNGDHRADVVGFADAGVTVALSTGSGLTAPTLWRGDFGYIAGGWRVEKHPRFLADVNGDGRADVVGFSDAGVTVALSTGGGLTAPTLWRGDFGYIAGGWRVEKHPRFLADVNGDGRADVVGFADAGALVALSTGSGLTAPTLWLADLGYLAGGWRIEKHPRLLADLNGDGLADVIGFADAGAVSASSIGSAFRDPATRLHDFGYEAGGWRVEQHPRLTADVNGDGRADVVGFADAGVVVSLSN